MAGLRYPSQGSGYCRTATAVNLLLGVFQVLLPCFRPGEAQGQAAIDPIPNVVELWQAEEGELLMPAQAETEEDVEEHAQEQSLSTKMPNGSLIHFHPSILHFGMQLLGLPKAKMLYAYNPSRDRDVIVNSVFTATRHFHVSPVHSRVFGTGTSRTISEESRKQLANTYLLLPHINSIQISQALAEPRNVSHLKVRLQCSLHNKLYQHFKNCCFASDDQLLLEISLMVRMENMQHEFVDLRQYLLENLFVVYVAMDKTHTSDDSPVILYVLHSGNNLLYVQDIKHLSQEGTFSVLLEPILLPSSATNFTEVASIVCKGTSCGRGSNHIVNETMNLLDSTTLPRACLSHPVIEGYFGIDPLATVFHVEPHHSISASWSLWFTNNFDFSIVLNDVYVSREMKDILKVMNFSDPLTLPPGCWNVFSLKLHMQESVTNLFANVFVATNVGMIFEIPLQIYSVLSQQGDVHFEAIAHHDVCCSLRMSDKVNLLWERSLSLDSSTWSVDSDLAYELHEKWQKIKHNEICRRNLGEIIQVAHPKNPEEESFALSFPHLVTELGLTLNFSAAAPTNSMVKYFTLRNPTSFLVMLQLLPLSFYPDPRAPLSLFSKWFGMNVQSINLTTTEFRLTEEYASGNELHEDHDYIGSSSEVLHLKLQPLEAKRVGVVFTPLDYKRVASLILIRNNLTVLDAVYVEGIGARELLKVGGRLPGAGGSLRFKVPESTLMDCRRQLKDGRQILSITKNFKVENVGHLPITVTSMKINGYNCQGYGFEVLNCQDFFLAQNSSREISIVFTPDFTSSWIIRELTLVTAAGVEFHFTLNVTLPHHLLPLCAEVVPGPSWEESFWRLTVLFVSLSLFGVILIAFQQAQYILTEFMKSRQRPNTSSSPLQNNNSVDIISSETYKSSCKTFTETYSSSDKGKGKGSLSVSTASSRSQNAAKRSPATYSHSQKKHKCSVYYGKPKSNTATGGSVLAAEDKQNQIAENQTSTPKEDICTVSESWLSLKYANSISVNVQKNLTHPGNFVDKEESALKNATLVKNTSSEGSLKEGLRTNMFPKETNLKTSENITELKEPELCPLKSSKKPSESRFPRHSPQQPSEFQDISRKNNGNNQQVPLRNETENCETLKKQVNTKPSAEKMINKGPKDDSLCGGKQELSSVELEGTHRKNGSQEKREGHLPNTSWNRHRTNRKNKKKHMNISARVPEQTELKHVCNEFERPELRTNINIRNWYAQSNGETCKGDEKASLSTQREAEGFYQWPKKKCLERFCSDSSSDCGSSSGSVRASRGSWGSWSSTSSSDGDKKPIIPSRPFLPSRENISCSDFTAETPITLNLSHNICNTSRDVNNVTQYPETMCPNFSDITVDPDKNKGLYPAGDLWAPQSICLANSVNYSLENNISCVIQENPSLQNGFIDWNASCDGQFTDMYCPVEVNEYNTFTEENMNYHHGFPCTAEVQNTAFIDHNCQSTWNAPPNLPSTWEPTSYVNPTSYLSSTRSLSPMSGLFGSIWAPQSDVYESCCPVSAATQHSTQVENQAVLCKQEYYPRFNPFRAYMNLDIWTSAANRNANFPISRDSGYCGNV
ncbi:transmembrane protein 131-like isoform X4 [Varanus komodoensis]|uniref:transmembrane protein 131-like isoform X4 n=1 Tax=Varanus komodoensis TaxID=61221 RepID=UPI001CF79342|nr:transmembrane protein 131-like isoform X4 [Varanus komodoensis]